MWILNPCRILNVTQSFKNIANHLRKSLFSSSTKPKYRINAKSWQFWNHSKQLGSSSLRFINYKGSKLFQMVDSLLAVSLSELPIGRYSWLYHVNMHRRKTIRLLIRELWCYSSNFFSKDFQVPRLLNHHFIYRSIYYPQILEPALPSQVHCNEF